MTKLKMNFFKKLSIAVQIIFKVALKCPQSTPHPL
jgi:hypothetical protein